MTTRRTMLSSLALALLLGCGSTPAPGPARRAERAPAESGAASQESPRSEPEQPQNAPDDLSEITPLPQAEGSSVTDIAAGPNTACAAASGSVLCWGLLRGLLEGAEDAQRPPARIPAPPHIVRLATNGSRLYGVDRDGVLHRWSAGSSPEQLLTGVADVEVGSNDSLGVLMVSGEGRIYRSPRWMSGGSLSTGPLPEPEWRSPDVAAFAWSQWMLCALVRGRGVECTNGTRVDGDGVGVLVEYRTACLLRESGPPVCSDDGASEVVGERVSVAATTGWTDARWGHCLVDRQAAMRCEMNERTTTRGRPDDFVMGRGFVCALRGSRVSCWGDGQSLWLGQPVGHRGPVSAGVADGVELHVDGSGACVSRRDGTGRCWGPDPYEGPDDADFRARLSRPSGGSDSAFGCVLSAGRVRCRPGDRDADPVPIPRLRGVVEFREGSHFHCARTAAAIACWFNANEPEPVRFRAPSVRAWAIGSLGDLCVVTEQGGLECAHVPGWGTSPLQPFLSTSDSSLSEVLEIEDAVDVGLATNHGCVLHESGSVSCFGDPESNQLGDGGVFVSEPFAIDLPVP